MGQTLVGVDGGSTKTIALVCDGRGRILGAARGPGSNCVGTDVEKPMAVVASTVQEALRQAGLAADRVAVAVCALAGADWPEDHVARQAALQAAGIARRVIVKNDAFAGLRAGTRNRWGVGISAGTFTNTAVITPDGQEWAFGYYADYGGAQCLVADAIRAVLRQEDGRGQPTALTPAVLSHLGLPTPEALLRQAVAGRLGGGRALSLCPLVFEVAQAGDAVAAQLVASHGLRLAEYATALIRRFGLAALEFDVVLSGSFFKGVGPLLVDTITQAVHCVAPRANIVRAGFEPALGALLLALDAVGMPVTDAMYASLARTSPGASFFSTVDGGDVGWRFAMREKR